MRKLWLFIAFLACSLCAFGGEGAQDTNLPLTQESKEIKLSPKLSSEIKTLSDEVFAKTGIRTSVVLGPIKRDDKVKNYATLALDLEHKEIAVLSDLNLDFRPVTNMYYLKFGFLPTQGALLPLLSEPKGGGVEPALLNGFIAMSEIIAASKGLSLDGMSDFNDNFIAIIRLCFYAFVILVLIVLIRKKYRGKKI